MVTCSKFSTVSRLSTVVVLNGTMQVVKIRPVFVAIRLKLRKKLRSRRLVVEEFRCLGYTLLSRKATVRIK